MTKLTLIANDEGKYEWVEADIQLHKSKQRKMPTCGEDLTVDGYITKYGGIQSVMTDEVFSSKRSYMDHLKKHGKIIKDW